MGAFLFFVIVVLAFTILVMVGRANELSKVVTGKADDYVSESKWNGKMMLGFLIVFFISIIYQVKLLAPIMIPEPASYHGVETDRLFNVTLFFIAIVFFLTHIALFYFAYKYNESKNKKAYFYSHNNKLEVIWTLIPAIVLTVLVVMGMRVWFKMFDKESRSKDAMVIEVTAKQFAWTARYPGVDGKFGKRIIDKEHITPTNELGIDWTDASSHDDFFADKLVFIKDKPVLVKLGALDVLHSFYLPHFRVKMDCVPGIPTQFYFTPKFTTEEMQERLQKLPWWNTVNPETGLPRWKTFRYELACTELCGRSHYGMMKEVVVVKDEAEYKAWMTKQAAYYESIKGTLSPVAAETKTAEKAINPMIEALKLAGVTSGNSIENNLIDFITGDHAVDKTTWFSFDRLLFETGKNTLKPESQEQLKNMVTILNKFPQVNLKLGGYTDNTGKSADNLKLSDERAKNVRAELIKMGIDEKRLEAEGYGDQHPVASNDTEAGRAQNRRIDVRVTKK